MAEYIEREALKKELQKKAELSRKARYALIEEDFVDIINDMPAADVAEVKHGKWVDLSETDMLFANTYKCDNCNETFVFEVSPKECSCNYCPNCGARMDGEGE